VNTTRHHNTLRPGITLLLVVLVALLTGAPSTAATERPRSPIVVTAAHTQSTPALAREGRSHGTTGGGDEQDGDESPLSYTQARRLMRAVTPGLVDIITTPPGGDTKAGTGIVLTPNGLIVTNAHVVSGGIALSVRDLGNGLDYPARIIGVDPVHDIAVLKLIGATHLPTVRPGGRVSIGTVVASIGNAGGRGEPSLGTGRVIALGQSISSTTGQARPLRGLIEAINGVEPGESGGPMVTVSGAVVAITVATRLGNDGLPNGHGYGIPISTALRVASQLAHSARPDASHQLDGSASPTTSPSAHGGRER
jgi:S1-C subfamily serine protease